MDDASKYEIRVLSFVDILGFRAHIRRIATEPGLARDILHALEFVGAMEEVGGLKPYGKRGSVEMTAFSDCWVMSGLPGKALGVAAGARAVAIRFLELGLLTRGALVIGEAYHAGRIVFGEAMVRAFDIEQSAAKYPRIVVSDEAVDAIRVQEEREGRPESILRRDRDGCWFIDLFGTSKGRRPLYLNKIRALLEDAVGVELNREKRDMGHLAKVRWLVLQFNDVVRSEPDCGVEPIDIDGGASGKTST